MASSAIGLVLLFVAFTSLLLLYPVNFFEQDKRLDPKDLKVHLDVMEVEVQYQILLLSPSREQTL